MKKITSLALCFAMVFMLCACTKTDNGVMPITSYYEQTVDSYVYSSNIYASIDVKEAEKHDDYLWGIALAMDEYYRAFERYIGNPALAKKEKEEYIKLSTIQDEKAIATFDAMPAEDEYSVDYCLATEAYFDAVWRWSIDLVNYVQFGEKEGYTKAEVLEDEKNVLNCAMELCNERIKYCTICGLHE